MVTLFEIIVVVLLCFFANGLDHPEWPVPYKEDSRKRHIFCQCFGLSGWASILQRRKLDTTFVLQMLWIIRMGQPPAKRIIGNNIFLQMLWIIWMGQPLAKRIIGNNIFFANALDHPNGSASCKENNQE